MLMPPIMLTMKIIADQLIHERRSTWPMNFDPERKIEDSLIAEILETAIWAPSHGLTQPWAFKVFHDGGIRDFFNRIRDIYLEITPADEVKASKIQKYEDKIGRVSHVIAVCMIRDPKKKHPVIEEIVATSCVIENIYICINAFGIAGYLSTGNICYTQQVKDYLGLGAEDLCLGFFQLGYPISDISRPVRKRIPAAEKTQWIG
jgi:nitroreductase